MRHRLALEHCNRSLTLCLFYRTHAYFSSVLFLLKPSLTVLLDIGRLAAEYEAKSKQKHKTDKPPSRERAGFVARYGDLPALARISDVAKLLTSRTAGTQQELCTNFTSTEPLETVMQTFVTAAQLRESTFRYIIHFDLCYSSLNSILRLSPINLIKSISVSTSNASNSSTK